MSDEYDDLEPRGGGLGWPIVIGGLAIGAVVGGVVGYMAHAMFTEPTVIIPPPTVIQEQISEEDLIALCESLTDSEKTRVVEAHEKVKDLQAQLDARNAELEGMRAAAKKGAGRKAAAAKKWKEMESEIARLEGELEVATQERDSLRVELKATLKDLDKQIRETNKFKKKAKYYQDESTKNLWSSFMNNAKVEICDRGTRRRHEKCHESVEVAFDRQMRDRFTVCVDSYQAVPVLKQLDRKEQMPQFAERLPDDNKFTKKGWVVIFCDPTLPEASDADLDGVRNPGRDPDAPGAFEELPEAGDDSDLDLDLD